MTGLCLIIFSSCVFLHDIFRVKNARYAEDNKMVDRIFIPIAIAAAVVGVLAI